MTRISALVVALFLVTGCEAIPGMGPTNANTGGEVFGGVHEGDSFMTGRISTVQSFDDDLSINDASIEDGWLSIDLHAEGRYGWVMLAGNIDVSGLEAGDSIELTQDELSYFVGCAGPQAYDFDYDGAPDSVTITLSEPAPEDGIDVDVDAPDSDDVEVTIDADFGSEGGVTAVTTVPRQG
ncbi:MAG: hypothetical protein ACJAZO_001251 [Myxococcota bacterium]|jgi:hypothetical protein